MADYTEAPGAGGSVAFVMSAPITQAGTKVKSVQFNADNKLTVIPVDSTAKADGAWTLEEPNGPNVHKKGVVNFLTRVATTDGKTYVTVFTVNEPVCNPGNTAKPTNVFQIRGDRTLTVFEANGQGGTAADGAYQADR
ncbi:hypothetical protein [Streptomyces sp. NPDC053048]|uniref:hypothetical protein n=1 Tax=Streptomyces sp. NPDC053048 TaxID=3365694 RepID=UPI0037D281B0